MTMSPDQIREILTITRTEYERRNRELRALLYEQPENEDLQNDIYYACLRLTLGLSQIDRMLTRLDHHEELPTAEVERIASL